MRMWGLNRETGAYKVMAKKQVVETVEFPETEISLLDARKIDKRYEIGDIVEADVTPANFGRSAAHTAKQMLIQRLKEAERSVVYEEYYSREGDIITGVITRVEGKTYISILVKQKLSYLQLSKSVQKHIVKGTALNAIS